LNTNHLHPWHGIETFTADNKALHAFIEIVPVDTMKYEIHKPSGWLMIDRPQLFSNRTPFLYGFIPQTYCGDGIAQLAASSFGSLVTQGDKDPLDICVLCSKEILRGGILVKARAIGGLCLNDKGEADDKIIAVLEDDEWFINTNDISDLPIQTLRRIEHYFKTYKNLPEQASEVKIDMIYNAHHAKQVIAQAVKDYQTLINTNLTNNAAAY
jgi:inorganic pyrophosphatase